MRRGVWLLALGMFVAALSAASAYADGTSAAAITTASTPSPGYARLTPSFLSTGCVGAGDAAIAEPGARVLALGTPASARGPSAYPTSAPIVSFAAASASGSTCRTASVRLESVSLFGGLVTASSIAATDGRGTVTGLEVDGSPATLGAGQSMPLGYWGQVTVGTTVDRLTAPLVVQLIQSHGSLPAGTTIAVGFAASAQPAAKPRPKTKPKHHAAASTSHHTATTPKTPTTGSQTPASTPTRRATTKHLHHRKPTVPQPLTARPSLGYRPGHYVFPVNGGASYVDTYGGVRNDVYDGWHHGDDLFAKLGTPVVAVATGKLSLVGWNQLGGWRLWLTDGEGNSFYYAHLAGYSRWILGHPNVKAGQVVGFLGRTGDAFTTEPHLHFEIHPHLYLGLGYDGAVDPTTYLQKWHTVWVSKKEMPQPAKLKAPVGIPAQEAAVVWQELLVARHLLPKRGTSSVAASKERHYAAPRNLRAAAGSLRRADIQATTPLRATSAHVSASADTTVWLGGGLSGALVLIGLSVGGFFVRRRRRSASEASS